MGDNQAKKGMKKRSTGSYPPAGGHRFESCPRYFESRPSNWHGFFCFRRIICSPFTHYIPHSTEKYTSAIPRTSRNGSSRTTNWERRDGPSGTGRGPWSIPRPLAPRRNGGRAQEEAKQRKIYYSGMEAYLHLNFLNRTHECPII